MNCRIPEMALRRACRELLREEGRVSHRALRQVLRERFGAVGKTARVRKIWHEETGQRAAPPRSVDPPSASVALPTDVVVLQAQLAQAQREAVQFKARAELAEVREQSHQDRWALEIDRLRQELRAQPNYQRELRTLQDTVMRLHVELAATRCALSQWSEGEGETT
jgi:hypothetical protein